MDTSTIYKAIVAFHNDFNGLKPDGTNPYFKADYITLDGILEEVRPLLAKHGLAIMQDATGNNDSITVKTILIHESGTLLETGELTMKPAKVNDPQAMGSCITYAKRYQLAAWLGICETIDDDGAAASNKKTVKEDKQQPQIPEGFKTQDEQKAAIKSLTDIAKAKGFSKASDLKEPMQACLGKIVNLAALTYDEIQKFITFLDSKPS